MLQRAAAIASGPAGFKSLWEELVLSAAAKSTPAGTTAEAEALPPLPAPPSKPDPERLAMSAQYYGNRAEWRKAADVFAPRQQHADGSTRAVCNKYAALTPQAQAPREDVVADEPGVTPFQLERKVYNSVVKALPRARKGGSTIVAYEFLRFLVDHGGSDHLFNFCFCFGDGSIHEGIGELIDDLEASAFWKDSKCEKLRPLGRCDIFARLAEKCVATQEREWIENFCTSMLPEDATARQEAISEATTAAEDADRRLQSAKDAVAAIAAKLVDLPT